MRTAADPAAIAADLVLDLVLHELRRALVAPIYRVYRGEIAPYHAAAVSFGWLAPPVVDTPASGYLLALTATGRQALARAQAMR